MDSTDRAYLAGIIDGEGTVTLTRHHKNETHSPVVSVYNCKIELLNWIKKNVGGGVIVKRKKAREHHSDAFAWYVRNDAALMLLEEVTPYLILKKKHAELILDNYKSVTQRNGRYTQDMLVKKLELVEQIRKLNRR